MKRPLRFGICGLGFMGRTYFDLIQQHESACVVAVCDRDPARRAGDWTSAVGNIAPHAGTRARLNDIRQHPGVRQLLDDEDVDVVAITLPTPFHADVTVAALQAGKQVLCEKPMALSLAECDRMLTAAENSDRTLMIAQCIRFWPQYERIRAAVTAGRIGRLRYLKLHRLGSPPRYSADNWLLDARQSGGALLDLHLHDVDFVQDWLGLPEMIQAVGQAGVSGGVDHVLAHWQYADVLVHLEGGWAFHEPCPFEMAITAGGEQGMLTWNSAAGPDVLLYAGGSEAERLECDDETGWARAISYFIERVRTDQPVARCRPESSRTSVALALSEADAIQSARGEHPADKLR